MYWLSLAPNVRVKIMPKIHINTALLTSIVDRVNDRAYFAIVTPKEL